MAEHTSAPSAPEVAAPQPPRPVVPTASAPVPAPPAPDVAAPQPPRPALVPTAENLVRAAQRQDLELVTAILEAAGDRTEDVVATVVNDSGWGTHNEGALHAAVFGLKRTADADERARWLEIMRALLAAGANPNAQYSQYDWRGCGRTETAFEMILERGALDDVALLRLFLDAGADPAAAQVQERHTMRTDATSSHTPLHTVVAGGSAVDCALALIRHGADVDARRTRRVHNERGHGEDRSETALHVAVANGSAAMAAMLLGNGADVNATRRYLQEERVDVVSPTNDPREPGFVPSVRLVKVEQSALHVAIRAGNPDLVRLLVLHKADKSLPQSFGSVTTSAEELCEEHEPELKRRLLDALDATWSPDNHRLFPEKFKESVRCALLTAQRQEWALPNDVLCQIFGSAA